MAITLDPATQNEYLAGTTLSARSQAVVDALTGTVTCTVYDGSDVERAAATFDAPWAVYTSATVTVGEVGKLIVSNGGVPDGNWYVEISDGTRWVRGSFGLAGSGEDFEWSSDTFETGQEAELGTVTFTSSLPVTGTAPSNSVAPVVIGEAIVGQVLSATAGTWSGSPAPTYAYQWTRDSVDIVGATSETYTLTSSDLADYIRVRVTATNSVGSASATSGAVGPVTTAVSALSFSALPSPIVINQGSSVDLSQYASGGTPPYAISYSGTLPSGVTFSDPTLTAASNATVTTSGNIDWMLDDSEAAAALPDFYITSVTGGSSLPFVFGHTFAEGDVPSGYYVTSDLSASWQCTPLTYWPDGSVCSAIIGGRATCTANVAKRIVLSVTSTAPSGANVAESTITSSGRNVVVTFSSGVTGTVNLSGLVGVASAVIRGSAGRISNRVSGPVFSEYKYYSPVGSDAHLAVFITIRIFADGRAWSRVTVENGWWNVAAPGGKTYNCTISIDGTTQYTGTALDHRHHTRWSLEFWHGGDPQIIPQHDKTYLRATKLVPNFIGGAGESLLAGLSQTYTPFASCNLPTAGMDSGGYAPWIGLMPEHDVAALVSTDARAWKGMVANAHAYGMYGVHYRDETTLRPVVPTAYPTMTLADTNLGLTNNSGSGTNTPVPSGSTPTAFAASHHPSPPYLAYLLTGDEFYAETVQFVSSTTSFLDGVGQYFGSGRNRGSLTFLFQGQTREEAWRFRTLFLAARVSEPGSALETGYKTIIGNNAQNLKEVFIDGTALSGEYKNNLGVLSCYLAHYDTEPTQGWEAPWQYQFMIASWGWGSDLGISLDTTQRANMVAVRDHGYKWSVGRVNDGSGWCYRRAGTYSSPISYSNSTLNWIPSHAAAFTEYLSHDLALVSDCTGTTLFQPEGNTEIDNSAWDQGSSWISVWPALSYAVDHGAPGASAGWARLAASSTYVAKSPRWQSNPMWGINPRAA